MAFNPRFVNGAGDDLIAGKIHTVRQNYDFWKRFEGQDAALYAWQGKPYRSIQRVFCVNQIDSVLPVLRDWSCFYFDGHFLEDGHLLESSDDLLFKNDGFESLNEFRDWFRDYPCTVDMAVVHFTEFRYG
jgi:hypothetical protein